MATLPPPPLGVSINEETGFMSKGWVQWFQDIKNRSADGHKEVFSATLSSNDTVDITSGITGDYEHYRLVLQDIKVSQPNSTLNLRVSTDTGTTFKSGASDYTWLYEMNTGTSTTTADSDDSELTLTSSNINNTSSSIINGNIEFFTPAGTTNASHFKWELQYKNSGSTFTVVKGGGLYNTAAAFDSIRLYLNQGKFTSGKYKLYGIR